MAGHEYSTDQASALLDFPIVDETEGTTAVPVTFTGIGGKEHAQTVHLPAGVELDRDAAVRDLRLWQVVASSLPAETLNTLGSRYERELPLQVAPRLAERLREAYRYLLDRAVQEDGPDAIDTSLPHLEVVTVDGGRRTVGIVAEQFDESRVADFVLFWVRGMIASEPMRVAEHVLIEYAVAFFREEADAVDLDAVLASGRAVPVRIEALDKEAFREKSRPVFEKEVSRLVALVGRALQLRRVSLQDLERLMGLRPVENEGELFAYLGDDGPPAIDYAPRA
jgi:hypothetical protein